MKILVLSNSANGSVASITKYTSSGSKNVSNDGAVQVENGSFTVSLDAQSVTTLTGKRDGVGVINEVRKNKLSSAELVRPGSSDFTVYDLKGNQIRNSAGLTSKSSLLKSGVYIIKTGRSEGTKYSKVMNEH